MTGDDKREPNSHECLYFGRKLSNFICDDIEVSKGYVNIGSENDDEIYWGDSLGKDETMLKERVRIHAMYDGEWTPVSEEIKDEGYEASIDLEDILRFAAANCRGIYERVLKEVPKPEGYLKEG